MGYSRVAIIHTLPNRHCLRQDSSLAHILFPFPAALILTQKTTVYRSISCSRRTAVRALSSSAATKMVKAIRIHELGGPEVSSPVLLYILIWVFFSMPILIQLLLSFCLVGSLEMDYQAASRLAWFL